MRLLPILPQVAAILIVASGSPMRTSGAHSPMAGELRTPDPYVGCAPGKATSTPIPFERVDLGPAGLPQGGNDLLLGPRMLAVISDSTTWPAVWRAAVDTVPVPKVTFGVSVPVLVATRTYGLGRIQLRVTSIRQCRESGTIVVSTMQTGPRTVGITILSRGFDVVRLLGRELATNTLLFEDHFRSLPY